jgi:amino acid permease
VISILFGAILFPLCKLKDFTALRNVSKLGLLGQLIATIAILVRYFDNSYRPGGAYFLKEAAFRTAIGTSAVPVWKSWFILASLLSYCFVAHYNAPKYYSELDGANPTKFRNMATVSYMSSAIIYVITMVLGTAAFGMSAKPFLLNNLSPADPLAVIARLAFGASVLASFPLIFMVMRNWFISLAEKKAPIIGGRKRMTAILLTGIALLTANFRDISFVGSLSGATLGCGMAFIFPSIIYMRAMAITANEKKAKVPMFEMIINGVLLTGGIALSCLGTFNSLFGFKK